MTETYECCGCKMVDGKLVPCADAKEIGHTGLSDAWYQHLYQAFFHDGQKDGFAIAGQLAESLEDREYHTVGRRRAALAAAARQTAAYGLPGGGLGDAIVVLALRLERYLEMGE